MLAFQGPLLVLSIAACMVYVWLYHVEGGSATPTLSPLDSSFCHGGLEVIYPEVIVNKCLIISPDLKHRERITKVWDAPQIRFPGSDKRKKYVLMMVDPDAPSRASPTLAHWRHWLVMDIQGDGLRRGGELNGTTLSEYARPTPPQGSGFHRYQFMLFEQPEKKMLLTKDEKSSLGNWDPLAFIEKFDLGVPVAAVQFLTQNHKD